MLNIIGGTYLESCVEPNYMDLYGSGLRAACALSNKGFDINYHTCISEECYDNLRLKSTTFGFSFCHHVIERTIEFNYYHPLSKPQLVRDSKVKTQNLNIDSVDNALYYGLVEAKFVFNANYVVYDPQNHERFSDTGSTAQHLAVVLNKNEALMLSKIDSIDLNEIGISLLESEGAEVIIIKNGAHGALVFVKDSIRKVPVYETKRVWPIGSGDIFSAVFAWQWMIEKRTPFDAAVLASKYTAQFCETQQLPLNVNLAILNPIEKEISTRHIYIAAPFFTICERWLVNEIRNSLLSFGNYVFSPFHDVGIINNNHILQDSTQIAEMDLDNLKKCDTILAVISGIDAGTLFEIGYAVSLKKRIVILSENINDNDLTMMLGTNCEITTDFSTAIYKASW